MAELHTTEAGMATQGASFPERLEGMVFQTAFLFEAADALFSSKNVVTDDAMVGFFLLYDGVVKRLSECVAEARKNKGDTHEHDA